jgi:polygalacturonase
MMCWRLAGFVFLLLMVALGSTGCSQVAPAQAAPKQWDVRAFGALGDGKTKDTAAFQKALDACAVSGGGEVVVPAGNYLVGSVQLGNRTLLRLSKESVITGSPDLTDYPMMDVRWEGRWEPGHRALIYAANVDGSGIVGPGRIEGNAEAAAPQNPRGAVVLEAISCNHVRWEDFTVNQGGNWATHPTYCTDVLIKNVKIVSRRDGIDVDSCDGVRIEGCDLDTGDDSISLKSGRGLDGARLGKPTAHVLITHCTLRGRRFACLGIGSETSGGVRDVRIEHCQLSAFRDCIYIKTRIGRAGVTENISGDDLEIGEGTFLRINLISAGNTNTSDDPVEGILGYPVARNICFSHIRLTHAATIAEVSKVSAERPVEGLRLTHISGIADHGIVLVHVRDAEISDIYVAGLKDALLQTEDVTGAGLNGAVPYQAPVQNGNRGRGGAGVGPAN